MSDYNILQSLREIYATATTTTSTNTSYIDPPEVFKSEGKHLWFHEGFIPASSESLGKSPTDNNEDRGIYQITVYTPLDVGDYGKSMSDAVSAIKGVFYNGATNVYIGQKVDILEVTTQGVAQNESWVRRVMSINYLTISTRN
jgi:hypothetical protein